MASKIGEITLLQISNLRCIKFVNLEFNPKSGELVKIAGPNDSGKSTVLDAIKYAFEGAAEIPKGVIRNGLYTEGKLAGKPIDRANVRVETDAGYIIERVIRTNKAGEQVAELTVSREGEGPVPSAQSFLNDISSRYPDPAEIAELSGKDLFRTIVDILDIDLSSIDEQIEQEKSELQVLRRERKALGAEPVPPAGEEVKPVSVTEAMNEYEEESRKLNQYNVAKQKAEELGEEIYELEQKLEQMHAQHDELNQKALKLYQEAPSPQELEQLKEKINNIEDHNRRAQEWIEYQKKIDRHKELEAQMTEHTTKRDELIKQRKEQLMQAPLPAGLKLDEEGVWQETDTGLISWDSLSVSARLSASTLLAIHSIPEGAPRYLYVHRGESLGTKKREQIAKLASENDVKVFMEVMTEDPTAEANAIVIQEGEAKQYETPPVEEKRDYPQDLF